MSEKSNTATELRARVRPVPLTPAGRLLAQEQFLEAYRESANVKYACAVAGINRSTFYRWKARDKTFQEVLTDVEPDANDTLEYAAFDRAVNGVESYVVSHGRIVYVETETEGEDGKKVKTKTPLMERKYSDTLLITLLKARMPEKYKDRQQVDVNAQISAQAEAAKAELVASLAASMTDEDQSQVQQT